MAYAYYPGCEDELPDHIVDDCPGSKEHARVRSIAFIHTSYLATLLAGQETPSVWVTGINDRKIIIIPQVSGQYDGGEPVEGPGYGDQESSLAGYKHTIGYKDPNYKQNAAFYNAIKFSRDWVPAWRTETQTQIADVPAQIIPKAPITDQLTDEVVWDVQVKFTQPDIPVPFDTPADIFIPFALTA